MGSILPIYPPYLPQCNEVFWVLEHEDDKHIGCLHLNSLGITKIYEPLVWVKQDSRGENASIGISNLVHRISIPLIYLQT